MNIVWRAVRARARSEAGMSLPELLIAMEVMAIAAGIFVSVVFAVQNAVTRQQYRSSANDQARMAVEQMDREIRSGNLLYDPSESFAAPTCGGYACVSGYSVRVYTQANATTRIPPVQCVQWLVQDRKLLRRAWAPGATASLSGWRVVAEDVVNRDLSPPVPVFAIDPTPGGRVLDVTIMVNPRLGTTHESRTVRLNTSIAIRNSSTGDPCTPVPQT